MTKEENVNLKAMWEGGRDGRREGGREGLREGGREGGKEGGREGERSTQYLFDAKMEKGRNLSFDDL